VQTYISVAIASIQLNKIVKKTRVNLYGFENIIKEFSAAQE
jgi:hypothetical protein